MIQRGDRNDLRTGVLCRAVTGTNEQMIAFWTGPGGEAWARNADEQDQELQALGDAALGALAASPGESVLDVGCGPGTSPPAALSESTSPVRCWLSRGSARPS
jgi:hypothetical protein